MAFILTPIISNKPRVIFDIGIVRTAIASFWPYFLKIDLMRGFKMIIPTVGLGTWLLIGEECEKTVRY